uniref:DNA replication licensing factor MCM5 n=2 Tax=Meloidogyne TaxID=189290 RepID=A0A914LTW6_MELIC
MSNLDNPGIFYQGRTFTDTGGGVDGGRELVAEYKQMDEQFQRFIKEFSEKGMVWIYREQLKKNYTLGQYYLTIQFNDLRNFEEDVANKLRRYPATLLPALESAAKKVANDITNPRPAGQEEVRDIQIMLNLDDKPQSIRHIKSSEVSQLVKISGIIVAASQVRFRSTRLTLQCRTCRHTISDQEVKPGFEQFQMPRRCLANQVGQLQRCPMDPYAILPDKCRCVDFQQLKLQELPEDVPHSEIPRHLLIYVDRYLTDRVTPGNRITVTGIYSIKRLQGGKSKSGREEKTAGMAGIRVPYIRAIGIEVQMTGLGHTDQMHFTPKEERQFRELAKNPKVYEIITKSIAPSIYGADDIKRAIACLLFSGSRKILPDGLTRRGDINVLLLGDPGTAKSQLLKFVERVAPIAVYTSGKGSSAAGLTASVIRDPASRSFIMEGGAMVLADGGVVCIDEFDKMREDDRVAIHEAMEQQTISIAKAGITTTLNSRCSVLAAANSVFGRWDDTRGDENIDFMPTILSRFDCIFVVKDQYDRNRDAQLAKHIVKVHTQATQPTALNSFGGIDGNINGIAAPVDENMNDDGDENMLIDSNDGNKELSLDFLKRYIAYARAVCGPRISETASELLLNQYVKLRNPQIDQNSQQQNWKGRKHGQSTIPVTVRQLEAIIRLSESLAKMELLPFTEKRHVEEAIRLFKVSTIAAAQSGSLSGVEGFTSREDQESFDRVEKQLKRRFQVGTYVSEHLIIDEFSKQSYPEALVRRAIDFCVRRGDFQYRMQRKLLYRVK